MQVILLESLPNTGFWFDQDCIELYMEVDAEVHCLVVYSINFGI